MAVDLAVEARERGIKYFLISYVDLFGTLRAKLAPASAIGDMAKDGAGFAGFASWLDMTPADPDVLAIPDPASLIQLPWKPEVGWLAAVHLYRGRWPEAATAAEEVLRSPAASSSARWAALIAHGRLLARQGRGADPPLLDEALDLGLAWGAFPLIGPVRAARGSHDDDATACAVAFLHRRLVSRCRISPACARAGRR